MSTIAINKNNYVVREEKAALKERLRNYFKENRKMITTGLLLMNGNVDAYQLYKLMK